jgi:DNA processing protein
LRKHPTIKAFNFTFIMQQSGQINPQAGDELLYRLAINMVPGVGGVTAKKLLAACGSAEAVFREPAKTLVKIPGIGQWIAGQVSGFRDFARAEKEIAFLQKHAIKALFHTDPEYPERLKQCADGPVLLFVKGSADLHARKVVAVVGTRNMSAYGRKKCREIVEGMIPHKVLVVSGLAYGVDACAHKAAVDCGLQTVAVLGHGLDRIYPATHADLARSILKGGALVSDFPTGTVPDREKFPKRNRIIAGISDAVVVVEAAITGGALITAMIANSYHRDVFALPGRTTDPYSMGCNKLIKSHQAHLIESAADLEFVMNWEPLSEGRQGKQTRLFPPLTKEESVIAACLKNHPDPDIDKVSKKTGLTAARTAALLLNMELKGMVEQLPGKRYSLLGQG